MATIKKIVHTHTHETVYKFAVYKSQLLQQVVVSFDHDSNHFNYVFNIKHFIEFIAINFLLTWIATVLL